FSLGHNSRRPSVSLPLLIVMQSSPTSIWQFEIRTFRHDSGLIPSVFGDSGGFWIVTLSIITLSHASGLIVQYGDRLNVSPSTSTFLQFTRRSVRGRITSRPLDERCISHHISPRASIVPRPTSATFSRFSPANSGAYRGDSF